MNGKFVKEKLKKSGVPLSEIAARMGYDNDQRLHSQLKSNDVKTGLLEQICNAIGVSMAFFYPIYSSDGNDGSAVVTASHSAAISGNGNNINANDTLLEKAMGTIADQQQTISTQTNLIAKLIDQKCDNHHYGKYQIKQGKKQRNSFRGQFAQDAAQCPPRQDSEIQGKRARA